VTFEANWRDASGKRHIANFDTASKADTYRQERLGERRRGGTGDPSGGKLTAHAREHRQEVVATD